MSLIHTIPFLEGAYTQYLSIYTDNWLTKRFLHNSIKNMKRLPKYCIISGSIVQDLIVENYITLDYNQHGTIIIIKLHRIVTIEIIVLEPVLLRRVLY